MSGTEQLPVHGFVLAGGASRRMGRDKALVTLHGRALVEIAVEKLRTFCAQVSIVGERPDLAAFAPIATGERPGSGPAAGIEAALRACQQPWALFVPVDVPLVPEDLLRRWAEETLTANTDAGAVSALGPMLGSMLVTPGSPQPAFAMLHRDLLPVVSRALDRGERRLRGVFAAVEAEIGVGRFVAQPVTALLPDGPGNGSRVERWFQNVNTPAEHAALEAVTAPDG